MQPVTITLNQKVVSGHGGMTILEIARESGIEIPTLCHDPGLQPLGACRLCLVENEENGALLASCVTAAAPGMIINTNSPRVIEHRKNIVKLLLASHPDACLICDKGNRCRLQQIATSLGLGFNELEKIPHHAEVVELNPFITRDTSKCVLCGKCIRACQEIVVEGAINYYQRGFTTRPATFNDRPLEQSECTFCGLCVAICPTGALMEKDNPNRGTGRLSVQTTCPYCGCGCPVILEIKGRRVVRALPGDTGQNGLGTLCVRGSYGFDFIHSPERLKKPLVKKNGSFMETGWEEALEAAAEGLLKAKKLHGPGALAAYGSARCTNEENYLLQRFARTVLDSNNIDHSSNLYHQAALDGLSKSTGFLNATNLLDTLEQADVIMVIGTDPTVTAPRIGYAIKRAVKNGRARLILVEPRQSRLSFFAEQWIRPAPGSEAVLLNSMARVIIDEKLLTTEYLNRQTEGFQAFSAALKNYLPELTSGITAVSAEDTRRAARLYAGADRAIIVFGSSLVCAPCATESVKALTNLALMTENVWGNGSGIYPVQKECNSLGAVEMGCLPDYLPGYRPVSDVESRQHFERLWKKEIPSEPGKPVLPAFNPGHGSTLKALYVVGEDPASTTAGLSNAAGDAAGLDFLVVQDLFLTRTALLADVVFPASGFTEKEGSFTNFEGKISWLKQAFSPAFDSLPDWEIILRLAKKMGTPLPYTSLQQVISEIEEYVPLYEGYYHPEERLGEKVSYWEERRDRAIQSLVGFPGFSLPERSPRATVTRSGYQYHLVLEPALAFFGTGTRSGNSRRLAGYYPPNAIKISAEDAEKSTLVSGDLVHVISPGSRLQAAVEISEIVPPGTVSMPVSFPGAGELFPPAFDTGGKPQPPGTCYVTLERVNKDG